LVLIFLLSLQKKPMKEKKYFITISLLLFSLTLSAYNISQDDAVSIVQQYRNIPNDHGRFYVAETDTLINNWACHIDVVPEEVWANGTSQMWLVFVDEQPNNTMWSHPCVYYYIPQQWPSQNNIPIIDFNGSFMPPIIRQNRNWQSSDELLTYSLPEDSVPEIGGSNNNEFRNKLWVAYIGGDCKGENAPAFYNDAAYLYRVLKRKYQIPDNHIRLLLANGGESREIAYHGQLVYMNKDLDGDGISDVLGSISLLNVENLFSEIAYYIKPDEHLLVVFDVHGESNNLKLLDNKNLLSEYLSEMLDSIKCASQCVVLNSCFSGTLIDNMDTEGRIIFASSDNNESWGDGTYNFFIHKWTNAINEYVVRNNYIDDNCDGWVSMSELFRYATQDTYEYSEFYPNYVENHTTEPIPQYCSNPYNLGDMWGINHLPDANALLIKDNADDLGEDGIQLLPSERGNTMAWESPDIWLRKSNDCNQNYEPIVLTDNDSIVYVYVRMKNIGYKAYTDSTRYLHLYWNYPSLRHNTASWTTLQLPTGVLQNAHELPPLQIQNCIDTTSTHIVCYEWRLPQELKNYAAANNGKFAIDVMARISDSRRYACYDTDAVLYPFYYTSAVDVLRQPNVAESCVITNGIPDGQISFNASFYKLDGENQLKIKAMNDIPSFITLRLSGASIGNVILTNENSEIDLSALPSNYSEAININCSVDVLRNQREQTVNIPIALLGADGMELGGFTLRLFISGSEDTTLDPGIEDSGEDIEIGDGGEEEIGQPVFGPRVLSMSNVDEPVTCKWTDSFGNILGEGPSLQIPYNVCTEYTLTVSALNDNATASVTKMIEPASLFNSISKSGDVLFIGLKKNAPNGTTIVLRSVINNSALYSIDMSQGSNSLSLNNSNIERGIYLVSIYVNGLLIETKQISL